MIGPVPFSPAHHFCGFSIRMSPRSIVSPGLTVKSLRIWDPLSLTLLVEKSRIRYTRTRDQIGKGDASMGVGERAVPVMFAVDIAQRYFVGLQLDLVLLAPAVLGSDRASRRIRCGVDALRAACYRARRTVPWPDRTAVAEWSSLRRLAWRRDRPTCPTRGRGQGY